MALKYGLINFITKKLFCWPIQKHSIASHKLNSPSESAKKKHTKNFMSNESNLIPKMIEINKN